MHLFEGDTADEVWSQAIDEFKSEAISRQESRCGPTKELLGSIFIIRDPRRRWVHSRNPAINPAFALAEVVWIVNGRDDAEFVNHWNPRLPKFAGQGKTYHGAYGFRLARKHGINQLERAYHALKANPQTRQVVLQIWDAQSDLPTADGIPASQDVPCNICSILKVRTGKLHWTQVLRSNDLFLGVPYNFVQFMSLHEIIAGWLGLGLGKYQHFTDCLHLYERDQVNRLTRHRDEPATIPMDIRLTKSESDRAFKVMERAMLRMIRTGLTSQDLEHTVLSAELPIVLHNWLRIIAADSARRRKWGKLSRALAGECTDPMLRLLWDSWSRRVHETVALGFV